MAANEHRDRPSAVTGAQRDRTTEWTDDRNLSNESNDPPNHGLPTHSTARFLWEVPKTTPVDQLGDEYRKWKRRQSTEQADLQQWGDDE